VPIGNLHQSTAAAALDTWPQSRIAISGSSMQLDQGPSMMRDEGPRQLMPFFVNTLGEEDTRRPRMELGLGIWNESESVYFPLDALRAAGGFVLSRLGARNVVVILDPVSRVPAAFYTEATEAHGHGDHLHFDNDLTYANGIFQDSTGERADLEKPLQLFTRWYGFSFTFPGSAIHAV
jgi:hypothetical protein